MEDYELADVLDDRAQRARELAHKQALAQLAARRKAKMGEYVRRQAPTMWEDTAHALLADWRKFCGHPKARATRERLDVTVARLADGFTVDELRAVFIYAGRTPSLRRYNDVLWLFQDATRVDRFLREARDATASNVTDDRTFKRGDESLLPGTEPAKSRRM